VAFERDTYVCLDLPPPIAERVLNIREQQRDDFRAALPAEITIAGSGGVGPLDPTQDPDAVFAALERIATETPPIEASFGPVIRFRQTDIFVLTLKDPAPLRALHERIAQSGISFRPAIYDFTPHCTLRSRSPVSQNEAEDLLNLQIQYGFVLDTMSVYMMEELRMRLLQRVHLTGVHQRPSLY
jgi:2'-5' RNA ligase